MATNTKTAQVPAEVQQVEHQGPSLIDLLSATAAELVTALPSQRTGKTTSTSGRLVRPAGSPEVLERYAGTPLAPLLEPLVCADGWNRLYFGKRTYRINARQKAVRWTTSRILAQLVYKLAQQDNGMAVDELYKAICHYRNVPLIGTDPDTGKVKEFGVLPEAKNAAGILKMASDEFNAGFKVTPDSRIILSDHPASEKRGSGDHLWEKIAAPIQ